MRSSSVQKFTILFAIIFASFGAATSVVAAGKVIVSVTEARVRESPNLNSKILGKSRLGKVYEVKNKRGDWYNITFENGKSGWISGTIVEQFDASKKGQIYSRLADKYLNRPNLTFNDAAELSEFLNVIQNEIVASDREPELSLKRLAALAAAVNLIPLDKVDTGVYREFTEANEDDIVYSEPAGQYFVVAERYWELRERFASHPLADEIAWQGSQTALPGECEGYLVCHLFNVRDTDGKYLELYPNGKYTGQALKKMSEYLAFMAEAADGKSPTGYYLPDDAEDRQSFRRLISELRSIVSKIKGTAGTGIINDLKKIENGKFDQDPE